MMTTTTTAMMYKGSRTACTRSVDTKNASHRATWSSTSCRQGSRGLRHVSSPLLAECSLSHYLLGGAVQRSCCSNVGSIELRCVLLYYYYGTSTTSDRLHPNHGNWLVYAWLVARQRTLQLSVANRFHIDIVQTKRLFLNRSRYYHTPSTLRKQWRCIQGFL